MVLAVGLSVAHAQTWHRANQATVAWDAVTLTTDGTPIPLTDVVRYRVYTKDRATGVEAQAADVLETQATLAFSSEGFWFVGVQAVRFVSVDGLIPEGEEPMLSDIVWSSDPVACANNETFGFRHHVPPGQVRGLRPQ
jgi:hypothetical protein